MAQGKFAVVANPTLCVLDRLNGVCDMSALPKTSPLLING